MDEALFGADPEEGIVAVKPEGDAAVRLWVRNGERVGTRVEPFRPFVLLESPALLEGFPLPFETQPLEGDRALRALATFGTFSAAAKAKDFLQKKTGLSPSKAETPYSYFSDPVHAFLLRTGKTLFKGMPFESACRLQLDIETYTTEGFEFPNAEREGDRITAISMCDSEGWERLLFGRDLSEREMLAAFVEAVRERDPDVLEGHNLFRFDLPYLAARAKRLGVPLSIGRDGSAPSARASRLQIAERTIDYPKAEIAGRHVVDTWILAQIHDVSSRDLESFGLKDIVKQLGLASADRTYLDASRASWYFDHEPEILKRYALDDAREVRALSALLSPPFFLQARMLPWSYQDVVVRGNATKIESLLVREHLRRLSSVPKPFEGKAYEGGLAASFREGIIRDVLHMDVASLYPSIMLAGRIGPRHDAQGVFLALLKTLRALRLDAKRRSREAPSEAERREAGALQQTFKVLINSFYGFLGAEFARFNDPEAAAEVTRRGREILATMLERIRAEGGSPIEADTDGVYFTPPRPGMTEPDVEALVARVNDALPEGIEAEYDGRYPAMLAYKSKNYALLDAAGRLFIKGSGLKSRGLERFQREFLKGLIRLLLEGAAADARALLCKWGDRIRTHDWTPREFAKTDTLQDPLEAYKEKIAAGARNPAAAYELAISTGRPFRPGDQVSYYVTGTKKSVTGYKNARLASAWNPKSPDENTAYYLAKLEEVWKKFEPFLATALRT